MAVQPIPEGYHAVTPYLILENADRAISFLKEAFGAEELYRMNMPDGRLMHGEIKIRDSRLMLAEASEQWPAQPGVFYLYVEEVDATYRRALEAGAVSVMEPADQFYGDRHGGVRDPVGNQWWIATHVEDVPAEELQRRQEAEIARMSAAEGSTAGAR
jgi:PhnB protein